MQFTFCCFALDASVLRAAAAITTQLSLTSRAEFTRKKCCHDLVYNFSNDDSLFERVLIRVLYAYAHSVNSNWIRPRNAKLKVAINKSLYLNSIVHSLHMTIIKNH